MVHGWHFFITTLLSLWLTRTDCLTSPGYRLPDSVIPEHYIVDVLTNLEDNDFSFRGKVWIKMLVEKPTHSIILHSRNLNISEEEVSLKMIVGEDNVQTVPIVSINLVPENEFLIVKTDKELISEKHYILHIPFHGQLTESLAGYYRSSYFDRTANKTKWLAVTQFESTDARRAFPCFDEPAMKAQFSIRLGHKKHLKSASNMPLINTTDIEGMDGWVWDKYADTVPMSTYLVAFMVSEFDYKVADQTDNNVTFRIWARKDALNQVEFARKVGPKFLEYYEKYFDVKYPLPKQDMVAIPDFSAGAMENWGLITYRETALLFDEKTSSTASKQSIASIIAHELAHQWFGNLVTMKWWTDLWLNEGFATYVAGLGVHNEFPEWNSLDCVAVENLLVVLALDSLKSSHPVSVTIGNPAEIAQIFDTISYKKGSYLLRMMNLFLGEEVFRSGVTNYLRKNRFKNAEQNDLWASLTDAAHGAGVLSKGMTVKEIMDTWTLQTGYPVITVTRNYEKQTADIEQKRHLAVKLGPRENDRSCWWVPISYTTSAEQDFNETRPKIWLSCKENGQLFDVGPENDWLLVNINAAGLYRVNYDERNWNNLAAALNSEDYKSIATLNRVQILVDSLEFAWNGDLEYKLAFDLLGYLRQEKEYLPWKSGLSSLNNIEKLLRRSSAYGQFKDYVRELLAPIYQRFSKLTETPTNFEEVKFKSLITGWACRMEIATCVDQALSLFRDWKREENPDTINPIPADMRGLVYCLGVKHGGQKEWEYLWERYNKSNVGTEQSLILSSLGCTREVWLLNRYLEMSIDEKSNIRRQDSVTVFNSVSRNEVGYYLAKNFLYNNVQKIYDFFGPKTSKIGRYITSLSDHMVSQEELDELKRFLDKNKEFVKYSALAAKQSSEATVVNIRWFSNYYSKVLRIVAPTKN